MNVTLSYDEEFGELLDSLRSKYGEQIFEIEGIGSQLDLNKFSKEFFNTKTTSDVSIDANANVGDSTVISYSVELTKPFEKLNSLYLLWKEMRRLYHTDVANKFIEMHISGDIYIHDLHSVNRSYCFNYSMYDLMNKGLPMIKKIKSVEPKYLYSFKSQLEQFIVIAANSTNGATGASDALIVMSYYVKNILNTMRDGHFAFASEDDIWAYVKETIISLIYTMNQPFRAGYQSPFVNISIYDKYFLEDMTAMYIFPDGSTPDIAVIQKLQRLYLEVMNDEMRRTPITFPVNSACFSIDENREFKDPDFVRDIIEYNKEFGFINLYSGKSTTLSSCCFDGYQEIFALINDEWRYARFSELHDNDEIFIMGVDDLVQAKLVKIDMGAAGHTMFIVRLINGEQLVVTPDHLHPTSCGDKTTMELSRHDSLVLNAKYGEQYIKIESIDAYKSLERYVYCLEVINEAPYFTLANGILTHNCRLRSDMQSIGYSNSIGGSSSKIGSVGVTTLNLYRLAKRSSDVNNFKLKLVELVGAAARVNHARRNIIRKKTERGFAPLYTYEFISLDKQFSTCGVNGFYEALEALGEDLTSESGLNLAIEIIELINAENAKYDKTFGYSHNCEAVPGESLSVKLAEKDKLLGFNSKFALYSNQFIPLTATADILERIRIQGALDSHFSGGSIAHLNFDKRIEDSEAVFNLLKEAVKQGIIYMAINYVLNECEHGHMTVGNTDKCDICSGQLSNKFSRIVGFLSNVKNWNKIRREKDFPNRKFYNPEVL